MKKITPILFVLLFLNICCEYPEKVDRQTFKAMVSHRNLGLAYLEEERYAEAAREFRFLVEIAPDEPLGYANLGLAYMLMSGELQQSEKWLVMAMELAPNSPDIRFLLAKLYELTGRETDAINLLQNTAEIYPDHIRTLYQLVLFYAKTNDPQGLKKAENYLSQIVNIVQANIPIRLRLIELLLNIEKTDSAIQQMELIQQIFPRISDDSKKLFKKSLGLMQKNQLKNAYSHIIMFHNLMKPTSIYQAGLKELRGTNGPIAALPLQQFLVTQFPASDIEIGIPENITFTDATDACGLNNIFSQNLSNLDSQYIKVAMAMGDFDLDGDQDLFVSNYSENKNASHQYFFRNNNGVFYDRTSVVGINHDSNDLSAIFADYNNDGFLDLFVTNIKENRLYQNSGDMRFFLDTNVSLGNGSNTLMAVFVDLDLEGDLDLFLLNDSKNQLYRNNSDGSFIEITDDSGISDSSITSTNVVFADFDDDGDVDIFVLNENGKNRLYDNLRQGYFIDIIKNTGIKTSSSPGAVAAGDYNNDGFIDLFITDITSGDHVLYNNIGDGTFELDAKWNENSNSIRKIHGHDATFFDVDNNGFLDLLISGTLGHDKDNETGLVLLYNTGNGNFLEASDMFPKDLGQITQLKVSDYDSDGDLDLFIVNRKRQLKLLRNDGGNINNYLNIRLVGLRTGSSKNNYFGIGSKVEVKAGDLYQVRYMDRPTAHFGLGPRNRADVVRVLWSNGVPQNRFKPERNQTIVETQFLKGSCPYLFAWNGANYTFVTDVLWPSALGMPLGIMAGEPLYAFPNSTDEFIRVPGDSLEIKDGEYLLQFTTELWETPYLDRIKLLAVDHPESVNVFIDETFIPPPFPRFRVYNFIDKILPFAVEDDQGNDLLDKIIMQDEEYISNIIPEMYQGVTEHHNLYLYFDDLDNADSLFLFLQGWLFPTDASINVNISQSKTTRSIFPYLQVPDKEGNWVTVVDNMGFPKGKNKTMIIDLTDKFITNDHRLRVCTNMQIYWDHIFISNSVSGNLIKSVDLKLVSADLHFRGFSEINRRNFSSPHIPDYYSIATGQRWRDLTGSYTRYGDVLPLLLDSDSRYVIMNAGDEITLRFDASTLPEIQNGWSRDFLFYNDGWLKDGDLNTARGQTVGPLPFHGMSSYPVGADEDRYPINESIINYRKRYNTRIIDNQSFKETIRKFAN